MKAIILAAGSGRRLMPLTANRPKCLTALGGKSLLAHCLAALRAGGASATTIVGGYRSHMLIPFLDKSRGDRLVVNHQWETSNMVHSLRLADDWLSDDPCIVSYSDIFYSPRIVRTVMSTHGDIVVAFDPNAVELWAKRFHRPLEDLENFKLGPNGIVTDIGGAPSSLGDVEGQYMGLFKTTPTGWRQLCSELGRLPSEAARHIDMTNLLRLSIEGGVNIYSAANREAWGEIDCLNDIEVYRLLPNCLDYFRNA